PHLITVKNQPPGDARMAYSHMVSPDALALVRYGLRSPADPRIVNTVLVIDRVLRTETRTGPVWHRYNDDGYGEHEDGSAFDGTGIGRGWPLLAGERGHYELAAGHMDEARRLLRIMRGQAGAGGLIPEQVWDAADIPEHELVNGCPSGSAMPLAWAHAEYVKLTRSLQDGCVFDTPPQTVARYIDAHTVSRFATWRFNNKARAIATGKRLRIEAQARSTVRWTSDDWRTRHDTEPTDTTLGIWVADLPTESLAIGGEVQFTFYWPDANRWEGTNYSVTISAP
ncbi:MAG: glucan 1,4-alpha-glucosidase, partial [Gemmatimonadaceae bacterium]